MSTRTAGEPVLRAEAVSRIYPTPSGDVHAVTEVDLELFTGQLLVVRGPSGSGKTTLLNMLGGLDRPTSGTVHFGDQELSALAEAQVLAIRRTKLSYIFQSFGLIPVLSAAENVEVPLRLAKTRPAERAQRVAEALDLVGLGEHANQRPYELSGGQQQRVGIARALVSRPEVLIADEPTGQLDSDTAATIMALLADLTHSQGLAAVVSTHDPLLMERADRVLELQDGHLQRSRGRHAAH